MDGEAASSLEWYMLGLVNEERTSRGLQPLQMERRLVEAAEDNSDWLLAGSLFSRFNEGHIGEGGSTMVERVEDVGVEWNSLSENIAGRYIRGRSDLRDDVEVLHDQLMNSAGHRANILGQGSEYVGIGVTSGADGKIVVTQNFLGTNGDVVLDERGGAGRAPASQPEPAPDPRPSSNPEVGGADDRDGDAPANPADQVFAFTSAGSVLIETEAPGERATFWIGDLNDVSGNNASLQVDLLLDDAVIGTRNLSLRDDVDRWEVRVGTSSEFDAIRISAGEDDLSAVIGASARAVDDFLA